MTIADGQEWTSEQKLRAHAEVAKARRHNELAPEPCAECGSTKHVRAHHEDYDKPLEVIWLCQGCHARRHSVYYHRNPAHVARRCEQMQEAQRRNRLWQEQNRKSARKES